MGRADGEAVGWGSPAPPAGPADYRCGVRHPHPSSLRSATLPTRGREGHSGSALAALAFGAAFFFGAAAAGAASTGASSAAAAFALALAGFFAFASGLASP